MGPDSGEIAATQRRQIAEHLASLYSQHAGSALKLAVLLVRNRDVAEDLVQEAFVRVAGRLKGIRNPEAFGAYLNRTVLNLARRRYRQMQREQQAIAQVDVPVGPMSDPQPSRLDGALFALPPRQRTVIYLRYYEDLSEEQAARVLGCSPGAVKSLTFRAMKQLRKAVEEGENERY